MNLGIGNLKLGEGPLIAGVLMDSDVAALEPQSLECVDIVELRVDMFDTVDPGHVEEVFRTAREKFGKPVIATLRDVKEGGQKEIRGRMDLHRILVPWADAIDVEVFAGDLLKQTYKLCMDYRKLLIGSYHNFELTPDDSFLEEVCKQGRHSGSDVVKIAVTAAKNDDFLRLMMLTLKHKDQGIITISMGDKGLPSRVFSPLLGSLITYGSINKSSAPGQLSAVEVMDIFRRLKMR
jgi:3-dehydroquinate dehydratase-1